MLRSVRHASLVGSFDVWLRSALHYLIVSAAAASSRNVTARFLVMDSSHPSGSQNSTGWLGSAPATLLCGFAAGVGPLPLTAPGAFFLPGSLSCRKRLAVMEYDVRPHEPYDVAIAGIFIVLMLVVTVLVFALA